MAEQRSSDGIEPSLPAGMPEALLTTAETARRLGITRQTLYGLMSSGRLVAVRIGGSWRIEPTELRRFIAESRTGG